MPLDASQNRLYKSLLDYCARLRVTEGRRAGEYLQLLPWQRRFLRGMIGSAESALSVPRANGKTTLAAAVAAASIDGPLRMPRGLTVVVAASMRQGSILYDHASAFLGDKLRDKSTWRVWAGGAARLMIEHRPTGARLVVIASGPGRALGLAPSLVLADEPSAWDTSQSERMIGALRTGLGKQESGRLVALGTRGVDSESWFSRMLDGGADYSQLHAARPTDNPLLVSTWRRANPSLEHLPDLREALEHEARLARRDPAVLASFRSYRLNSGTPDTVEQVVLQVEVWRSIEVEHLDKSGPVVYGIDLGTTAAMSAASAYWPATGALDVLAVVPEIPTLDEKGLLDGVGPMYVQMEQRGELFRRGRRVSSIDGLLTLALERWGPPDVVVCDRWRAAELADSLERNRVPPASLVERGAGFRDGAEDVRDFVAACLSDAVRPTRSLLLRSALASARTVSDAAGNRKLAKNSQGGRRSKSRDDALAAAILAVGVGSRDTRPLAAAGPRYAVI